MNMNRPRLSDQQRRAVEYMEGPVLVIAGPGSGKTRVITERVRRLLTEVPGHFRVLALTFTNKAANEMKDRLSDLGVARERAFIGTLHSFCSGMLAERGQSVGVGELPQIFEQFQDRKQVLLQAALDDPLLSEVLENIGDGKVRNQRVEQWLQMISRVKTHPITSANLEDPMDQHILDAYNAGLRASGAYDFDDLLLLAYRLLSEQPKLADFYRRLYSHICIDEAQDLNEAQYAVITALCGEEFRNVLMVGDPKQAIYGFNSSSPEFMYRFRDDFHAEEIELTENFRSSQSVVDIARALEPNYLILGQLPVKGHAEVLIGRNEVDEAKQIVDKIKHLMSVGHKDVEGNITTSSCAILGRTRFALLAIETELKEQHVPYYKRITANHQNESAIMDEFQLGLRILANPKDQLHLSSLVKRWNSETSLNPFLNTAEEVVAFLDSLARGSSEGHAGVIVRALQSIALQKNRVNLLTGIQILRSFADELPEMDRDQLYEDTCVMEYEWDQYLRSDGPKSSLAGFMTRMALGTGQQTASEGVALLTVHSSKGLEFDVVFIAGMCEGVFPDYRAKGKAKAEAEERRNAFVAVTRSKRLLYLSYPKVRRMPWGEEKLQKPSTYLQIAGLLG